MSVSFRFVDLTCPISRGRIKDPVKVPGLDSVYDRESVMEKIRGAVMLVVSSCILFPTL